LVYGLLKTSAGVSPNVSNASVLATLILFTSLYGVLGVICFRIVRRIAMAGPDGAARPTADLTDDLVPSLV
jgi:cytochrome d ubiquinol oxidase subunit I